MAETANGRPLNLICRRPDLDLIIEGQFMRGVLFSALKRPLRVLPMEDGQPWPVMDDSLILVLGFGDAYIPHLQSCREAGHGNIGILHMADEKGLVDCGFYGLARYVLRNYYFPERLDAEGRNGPPVVWIPNGYADSVGPVKPETLPHFADRQHLLFFSGNVIGAEGEYPERRQLFDVIQAHGLKSVLAETQGFASGFGRVSFAAHLANTKFAPAPAGMLAETIRLYDALENGAIPIAVEAPFLRAPEAFGALGPPPFPIIKSWDELPALVGPVQTDPSPEVLAEWEERRRETIAWWQRLKAAFADRVAEVIG